MNNTNDEKILITKEDWTWPPEYYHVYLFDKEKTPILITRLEEKIGIVENGKVVKEVSIKDIVGQYWIPTLEDRVPGKWMPRNPEVLLPRKNLWLYRKYYSSYYPERKCLAVWDEDCYKWLIGRSEYDSLDIQEKFDYYQIVLEPENPT